MAHKERQIYGGGGQIVVLELRLMGEWGYGGFATTPCHPYCAPMV